MGEFFKTAGVGNAIAMQPFRYDFSVLTNSDYTEELSFQVGDSYVDITSHTFQSQIKASPYSTTVLATLNTVGVAGLEGFYPVEPAFGALQVRINWETIKAVFASAYPSLLIGDEASLYHDTLVTLPSGDREAWLFGFVNVTKGITNG